MEYKILDAYRDKEYDNWSLLAAISGAVILGIGISLKETPCAIGGATILSIPIIDHMFQYGKAYMEARLDYLAHGKFTKLEEKVQDKKEKIGNI